MKAILLLIAQVLLIPVARADEQTSREQRLKEHERRVAEIIEQRRRTQQQNYPNQLPPDQPNAREDSKWQSATLWPGESYKFHHVTVNWRFSKDKQTTSGLLDVVGPTVAVYGIRIPFPGGESGAYVYLDDVAYRFELNRGANFAVKSINLARKVQPGKQEFTGARDTRDLFVSNVCPLWLEQWKLTVSPEPVLYPDGSKYYTLTATNEDDGTSVVMPINKELSRDFGRFSVRGSDMTNEKTLTALLRVSAQEDRSPRGRDTYVDNLERTDGETYGEFLYKMAQKYAFNVRWEPEPGFPESVDYTKKLPVETRLRTPAGMLDRALSSLFRASDERGLQLEWKDRTHLIIQPSGYHVVEERKLKAEDQELMNAEFTASYGLQTRVYPTGTMNAETALALIKQYLKTYALAYGLPKNTSAVESGEWYNIVSTNDPAVVDTCTTKVREFAIVDDASNSLIVTAVPATHAEIQKVLGRLQTLARAELATPAAKSYRIELILLGGRRSEQTSAETVTSATDSITRRMSIDSTVSFGDLSLRVDRLVGMTTSTQTRPYVAVTITSPRTINNTTQYHEDNFLISEEEPVTIGDWVVHVGDLHWSNQEDFNQCTVEIFRAPSKGQELEAGTVAPLTDAELAAKYGISSDDLKLFGLGNLSEMGKGVVTILGEPGEGGKARVSLTDDYSAELQFQDVRPPYVIVRGRLSGVQPSDRTLLENTLYLERDKPTLLGLTNLNEALILILRLHDKP